MIDKIINYKYFLLIIIASFFCISFGVWNAGVPFGDECGYIQNAKMLLEEEQYTANLYVLSYLLLLKFTPLNPYYAHIFLRSVSSLSSAILIYLMFKVVRMKLNKLSIIFISIFWLNCIVNIPLIQYGNINLFTLNIALSGIILFIRYRTLNMFFICMTAILFCVRIRPEYWIAFMLIPLYLLYVNSKFLLTNPKFIVNYLKKAKFGILVFFFSAILIFARRDDTRNFDQYLLLGLSQCYTHFYARINPDLTINPMLEYSSIIDEVFDHPTGFLDAFKKNPVEIINYLFFNGLVNIMLLVPSLLEHRQIIPVNGIPILFLIFMILLVPISESFFSLKSFVKKKNGVFGILTSELSMLWNTLFALIIDKVDIMLLIILSFVSSVSILLLIPDPRYWISCIPLLLLWLSWGFSRFLEYCKFKKSISLLIILICIWMSRPLFIEKNENKILIEKIEQYNKMLKAEKPVLAGNTMVGVYIFRNFIPMKINEISSNDFIKKNFDYLVLDETIFKSQFWESNKNILAEFVIRPENFGYKLIYTFEKNGKFLAAYGREI